MRLLVLIGGAIAAFFVLAAVLFAVMVDPNKYKNDFATLVKETTGRELVFEGDVKLDFFPRLGIETGGMRLSNPPGFDDKPFSRVDRASVSIKFLPLFSGRVEVGKVALDGLQLHLSKDEEGRTSWADILGPDEPASEPPSGWNLGKLRLDGVHITNASLLWDDRLLGERYAVSGLNLDMKAIRPGWPSEFSASFLFESAKPRLSASTEFSGTATLNAAENRHVFSELKLVLSATGEDVPGGKGVFEFGLAELKVDEDKQTATGVGLTFSAYGAKGSGQFVASNLKDGPDVKGRLDVPDFNGRELSAALTGKAPDTADAEAYQHITAALEFKTGTGYTEIPNFTAKLDDAYVEGRFRVTGLEKKAYSFNIRVNGLDADRFLPAKKQAEAANAQAQAASPGEPGQHPDDMFPVKTLRETKIDGKITAERLKIRGLRFTSLTLPVMCQDGILDLGQVEARLYDGTLKAFMRVDVQGDRPAVTLQALLSGVQQKPLFSDLAGKESQFAGTMTLDTVSPLVCQGNTMHALKRSLSGRVRFSVRDGVFPGVNILGVVQGSGKKAQDAVSSAGAEAGTEKSTRFGSIDGTAAINGGVASINDLDFKAPFLRADGRGTVDIPSKQTDYTLHVRVVPSAEGQGGSSGLLGLVVPLRITGPYDNLSYGTDYLRTIGKGALDAVGGVVQGIGNVLTGGGRSSHQGGTPEKKSGNLLDGIRKLF